MQALRILVADDHEAVRTGIRSLLASRPEWVVCAEAENGLEAVEKAKALHPDLVLMDVSMPDMDGLEATLRIRRELPATEVFLISQNDPTLMQRQASRVGARQFIAKSKISEDLFGALDHFRNANQLQNGDAHHSDAVQSPQLERRRSDSFNLDFLANSSDLAQRMRAFDWRQTPLGPIEHWPQSLKTSVSICLASRFPIVLYWGPEYVVLYNDAYSSILGSKHPSALGQTCRECWREIWDTIGPMLDGVVSSAQATWSDDLLLMLQRHGYPEECYFSFSFSPVRVETGAVGGVFTAVMETTDNVIGERRLRTLRDLAAAAVNAHCDEDVWRISAEVLAQNLHDVPFSAVYRLNDADGQVRLLATSGINAAHPLCASLRAPGSKLAQQLNLAAKSREHRELRLTDFWSGDIPQGAWHTPPSDILLLPISGMGQERVSTVLLAALSPHKRLDDAYRTFFRLLIQQLTTSAADARWHDEERKRIEALAEIDRAKTLFFSNISHEFRTPLTLMLSPLEELAAKDRLLPDDRERLQLAHRNSLRLLKLVNSLLDFSRIEAGRMQASYEPTDLAALTCDFASVFRSAIEGAGIRFVIDCQPVSDAFVDQEMWEKIVLNLLSNAFKFTFAGEIAITLRQVDSTAQLIVRDSGTGIPAHEIPKLFERFHRVSGARGRSYEGSGIGLALVQELVKLHGGSVQVESQLDRGSAFIVSIPRGKDHLPADRVRAQSRTSVAPRGEAYVEEALHWLQETQSFPGDESALTAAGTQIISHETAPCERGTRILLVEDNADMRTYVGRLLRDDYDLVTVSDGQAALDSARQQRPDLILSDVMMPGLDGFGLLQALRADPDLKTVPFILLSARAGEDSRLEGLDAGADDYLVKPFSARELLARVRSHLAMTRVRHESAERERTLRAQADIERGRIRDLFMQAPAAIALLTGPEHRFTFVNLEYLKATRRRQPDDFVGKTVREALPELESQGFIELLDKVYNTGIPYVGTESKILISPHANGPAEEVYFNFVYQAIRGANGEVEEVLVHAVDVTAQVLARRKIEERERASNLLAAIVDSSDDAIISKNLDGTITSWNKAAEHLFGYTAQEAVGKHITLIIPRERWKEEDKILSQLRRGERVDHFETVRVRKDGSTVELSLTISPVKDSTGRVIGASKVARDVSDRKRAERELRESERRLRHLSETLEAEVLSRTRELEERNADVLRQSEQLRDLSRRLLSTQDEERRHIARELHDSAGQTLTVLGMNLAQLVQKAGRNSPQLADDIERIQESVQQLHREIRTASYLLHPPLLDENGLSSALAWYIEGLMQRSGVQITLDVPVDFGRLPRDMELVVFRVVQECLTNIHRHSGSKTANIWLSRDGEQISIEVQDQGKGIPPDRLAEIQSRGTGVGIRGIRERLRQFGGNLKIDSGPQGTRITASIPVPANPASERNEPADAQPSQAAAAHEKFSRMQSR